MSWLLPEASGSFSQQEAFVKLPGIFGKLLGSLWEAPRFWKASGSSKEASGKPPYASGSFPEAS
jgi:hypothetical protein